MPLFWSVVLFLMSEEPAFFVWGILKDSGRFRAGNHEVLVSRNHAPFRSWDFQGFHPQHWDVSSLRNVLVVKIGNPTGNRQLRFWEFRG